jgi:hypothetical protein
MLFLPMIVMKDCSIPQTTSSSTAPARGIINRPGSELHRCVGNRLAETQRINLWDVILKRFPVIELVDEPKRIYPTVTYGIT